jgi:hypothetical protein
MSQIARHLGAGATWEIKNNLLELLLEAASLATLSQNKHLINEILNTFARNCLRNISQPFQI